MRKDDFAALVAQFEGLGTEATETVEYLKGLKTKNGDNFSFDETLPNVPSNISEILARIHAVCAIVDSLPSNFDPVLVPAASLANLQSAATQVQEALRQFRSFFESYFVNADSVMQLATSAGVLRLANGQAPNFKSQSTTLYNAVEGLLTAYVQSLPFLRPTKSTFRFYSAVGTLAALIGDARNQLERVEDAEGRLSGVRVEVEDQVSRLNELVDGATARYNEIENGATLVEERAARAERSIEIITKAKETADDLSASIVSFKPTLEAASGSLENQREESDRLKLILSRKIEEADAHLRSINDLVTKANQMLVGATNAGLAGHYRDILDKIGDELKSARTSFVIGIVFLTISLMPLLALLLYPVFGPLLTIWRPDLNETFSNIASGASSDGWQFVGNIVARLVLLLPAAWFVRFAAIRFASLFRLREHYRYKYSMAMSVEGFKQQASAYSEEIAALVLSELAFNPTDKLQASKHMNEGRIPNPLVQRLVSFLERRAEKHLNEKGS